jgi:2-polyprenyl-6-methoxyphenol hydroxylase-like FAD-dependent oxidoreductase
MFSRRKPEVLVVGAGPVGQFTALALAKREVPVRIIERDWRTATRSYALGLHAGTLRLMDELGVLGSVLERARRVRKVGLYDHSGRRAELRISDLAEDHSFLVVLPQDELETILSGALEKCGVKIEWSHQAAGIEQGPDGCKVGIEKLSKESTGYVVQHTEWVVGKRKVMEVPFVIGADGHDSAVRRGLEIGFPAVGDAVEFAVFEFRTDADLGDEMRVSLDADTTSVCWPLPGGCCRFSLQKPVDDPDWDTREKDRNVVQVGSETFPLLTEQRLLELLQEQAPWFRGNVGGIRWRMMVRFERRLVESFGRGRVWLLGDAAHLTGPIGVQSMNAGFLEAVELADAIAAALQGKGSSVAFENYDERRRRLWQQLLGVTPALTASAGTDPWVADRTDRLVSCIPAFGADFARLAAQIGLQGELEQTSQRRW